jgi:hypothetical protein
MQRDTINPRKLMRLRPFAPCALVLTVDSGGGRYGRRVPISLLACSYKP